MLPLQLHIHNILAYRSMLPLNLQLHHVLSHTELQRDEMYALEAHGWMCCGAHEANVLQIGESPSSLARASQLMGYVSTHCDTGVRVCMCPHTLTPRVSSAGGSALQRLGFRSANEV